MLILIQIEIEVNLITVIIFVSDRELCLQEVNEVYKKYAHQNILK